MENNKNKIKSVREALEKRIDLILNSKGCLDKAFDIEYKELVLNGTEIAIKDK